MSRLARSWMDGAGVVHAIPLDWGRSSYSTLCGKDTGYEAGFIFKAGAPTCLWCVRERVR